MIKVQVCYLLIFNTVYILLCSFPVVLFMYCSFIVNMYLLAPPKNLFFKALLKLLPM